MTDPVSPPTPAVVELKPCPFCGGPATVTEDNDGFHEATCDDGGCTGSVANGFVGEHNAIAAWNTRAAAPVPVPGDGRGEPVAWRWTDRGGIMRHTSWRPEALKDDEVEALGLIAHPAPVPVEPRPSAGADGERLINAFQDAVLEKAKFGTIATSRALAIQTAYDEARMALRFALRSNLPAETAEADQ